MISNRKYPEGVHIGLQYQETSGVGALVAPALLRFPHVRHFFSTRKGGCSKEEYTSLNLSWRRFDASENVYKNYKLACEAYGMRAEDIVFGEQVHGICTAYANVSKKHHGQWERATVAGVDALYTDVPGVVLVSRTADCVPILLSDGKAVAAIHSGWRGTAENIIKQTINDMHRELGTDPQSLTAVIGPSIGPCCFAVGEDVADVFRKRYPNLDCVQVLEQSYVDLWQVCVHQLVACGIPATQISLADECTCCHSDRYFSHRREKGLTGGMAAFIQLTE